MEAFKRIYILIKPFEKKILFYYFCSIIMIIFYVPIPMFNKYLIDDVLIKKDFNQLLFILILILAFKIISSLLNSLNCYKLDKLAVAINIYTRKKLLSRILSINNNVYRAYSGGDLIARFDNGQDAVISFIEVILSNIVNLIYVIVLVFILSYLNLKLFMLGMILLPLEVILSIKTKVLFSKYIPNIEANNGKCKNILQKIIYNLPEIKGFGGSKYSYNKYSLILGESGKYSLIMDKKTNLLNLYKGIVKALAIAIYGYFGWSSVINNQMTLGAFVAFTTYLGFIYGPVKGLLDFISKIEGVKIKAERYFELLAYNKTRESKVGYFCSSGNLNLIRISELSFGYNKNEMIFSNLNMDLHLNGITVIWGKSGIGKTTLLNLIYGGLKPESGKIEFLTKENKLCFNKPCDQISYVTQKAVLLPASIYENITLSSTINNEKIDKCKIALEKAACEFVNELKDGIFTEYDKSVDIFSQGEIQRISLARIFYNSKKIILIDEPTNNLDSVLSNNLIANIKQSSLSFPVIMVTHNQDLLKYADRIIEIKKNGVISVYKNPNRGL
ncbi:MAG: ABC transporter ATP-binding protein [Pseudomonadota bacterium]